MSSANESEWDFETQEVIEKVGTITLHRLYQLVQRGYKPDFQMEFTDSIWLRYPSPNWKHDVLILYPAGMVVSLADKTDEFRFYSDEKMRFERFLRSISKPSAWDKTGDFRAHVVALLLLGGWCAGFTFVLLFVFNLMGSWRKLTFG
jgi:hypothetical protein